MTNGFSYVFLGSGPPDSPDCTICSVSEPEETNPMRFSLFVSPVRAAESCLESLLESLELQREAPKLMLVNILDSKRVQFVKFVYRRT